MLIYWTVNDIMLLKICEESIFLKLCNLDVLCFLCIFIISFCLLFIVLFKRNYLNKKNLYKYRYIVSLLSSVYLLVFILFLFAVFSSSLYKNCSCKVSKKFSYTETDTLKLFYGNRVIVVGDSRMSLIDDDKDTYDIPLNYTFIAKSGSKIDWFIQNAIPDLEKILDNMDAGSVYHVVINMGVNDINKITNDNFAFKVSDKYFEYYKSLALKYPNVKFYVLSVNPIQDDLFKKHWAKFTLNNEYIEIFNSNIFKKTTKFKLIKYCDTYNNINFQTYDGLHYTHDTSQEIVNYIANKCVRYK